MVEKYLDLPSLKFIIVNYRDVTIGASGWTYFRDLPQGVPNKNILFAVLDDYGAVIPAESFGVARTCLVGKPNLKITNLRIKFFFYE